MSQTFEKLKNLNKDELTKFIKLATLIANKMCPIYESPNQKYDNEYFLICLVDFYMTRVSWNKYQGTITHPINGKYLNQIHNKYVKKGVYKEIHKEFLREYLKKGKEEKLIHQNLDSTFVANKGGSVNNEENNNLLSDKVKARNKKITESEIIKNNEETNDNNNEVNNNVNKQKRKKRKIETFIDFNSYNGRKKYFKVSSVTDSLGSPLSIVPISSRQSDNISLEESINNIPVELNTLRNSKVNRYKQHLLADTGYDSEANRTFLKEKGYVPIIAYNRRNCKDNLKSQKRKLKEDELKKFKKRFIAESFFSWIKNYPVLNQNYQKKISSHMGLLFLAASVLISKRI
jgi:transposase